MGPFLQVRGARSSAGRAGMARRIVRPMDRPLYMPGQRVRVTQQVPRQSGTMTTTVEGVIEDCRQAKTGSWFAHSRDHRLWLDRLEIRKDDGELVVCNLDQYSRVEVLSEPAASAGPGVQGQAT